MKTRAAVVFYLLVIPHLILSLGNFDTIYSIFLACGGLFFGLCLLIGRGRKPKFWYATGLVLLFALGLCPLPPRLQVHLILSLAVLLNIIILPQMTPSESIHAPRRMIALILVFVVLVTAIRIYSLSVYPSINIVDEPWTWSWAISYLRTGHFKDLLMLDMGDAYYAFPRFFVPMAEWMRLTGVGFWQARVFSFIVTMVSILITSLASRNLYGRKVGLATGVFMFASVLSMSAATLRHDVGLMFSVAASLWLYTEGVKQNRRILHLAAGIMMGLGMFSHYHASLLGVAMLTGLYLPRYLAGYRQRRMPEDGFWLYGIGGLVGAVLVFMIQIYSDDPNGFLVVLQQENKYSNDVFQVLSGIFYHFAYLARSPMEFILIISGLIAAAKRRTLVDQSLVLVTLMSHAVLGILASPAIYYYTIPLVPFYSILIATMFVSILTTRVPATTRRDALFGTLVFAAPLLGMTLYTPITYLLEGNPLHQPPPPAAEWVLNNVATTEVVAGAPIYYLWLHDYPYAADHIPEYLYPQYADLSREEVWERVHPSTFILDQNLESYIHFRPLVETNYFQRHGYIIASIFPGAAYPVIVYVRNDQYGNLYSRTSHQELQYVK